MNYKSPSQNFFEFWTYFFSFLQRFSFACIQKMLWIVTDPVPEIGFHARMGTIIFLRAMITHDHFPISHGNSRARNPGFNFGYPILNQSLDMTRNVEEVLGQLLFYTYAVVQIQLIYFHLIRVRYSKTITDYLLTYSEKYFFTALFRNKRGLFST